MRAQLYLALASGLLFAVACGGDSDGGSGTGGTAGSGTGGTAGAGGTAGSGGGSGTGGTAGAGGEAGTGGAGGAGGQGGTGGTAATEIACDPFETLDDFDGGAALFPTLVRSGDRAAAIWAERASGFEGVTVARYDFTTESWSAPFDVFAETSPGFTPVYDVAIDADGDIAALWREVQGGGYELWARIFDASTQSWGAPELVTTANGEILAQHIEYDRSSGEPMVAFVAPENGRRNAYFTNRGPSGWTAPVLLENDDSHHIAPEVDFVANEVGQALFVYFIDVGGTTPTWYLLPYDNGDFRRDGSNVLDPLAFESDASMALDPQADLADTGDGLLFVDDSFGSQRELLAARVDVDAGSFAGPAIVAEGEEPQFFWLRDAATSESGRAIAAWGQTEQIGGLQVPWVSVYDGSWSAPQQVGALPIGTEGVKTDIDENGTITVVWSSGFDGILATRNTAAGGAFLPQQELTGMVSGTGEVEVVAHDSGDFLIVWEEAGDIRAGRCR